MRAFARVGIRDGVKVRVPKPARLAPALLPEHVLLGLAADRELDGGEDPKVAAHVRQPLDRVPARRTWDHAWEGTLPVLATPGGGLQASRWRRTRSRRC